MLAILLVLGLTVSTTVSGRSAPLPPKIQQPTFVLSDRICVRAPIPAVYADVVGQMEEFLRNHPNDPCVRFVNIAGDHIPLPLERPLVLNRVKPLQLDGSIFVGWGQAAKQGPCVDIQGEQPTVLTNMNISGCAIGVRIGEKARQVRIGATGADDFAEQRSIISGNYVHGIQALSSGHHFAYNLIFDNGAPRRIEFDSAISLGGRDLPHTRLLPEPFEDGKYWVCEQDPSSRQITKRIAFFRNPNLRGKAIFYESDAQAQIKSNQQRPAFTCDLQGDGICEVTELSPDLDVPPNDCQVSRLSLVALFDDVEIGTSELTLGGFSFDGTVLVGDSNTIGTNTQSGLSGDTGGYSGGEVMVEGASAGGDSGMLAIGGGMGGKKAGCGASLMPVEELLPGDLIVIGCWMLMLLVPAAVRISGCWRVRRSDGKAS